MKSLFNVLDIIFNNLNQFNFYRMILQINFFATFVRYIDWLIITFQTQDVGFLTFFFTITFFKPLPLNRTQGENIFGKTSIKFILIFCELESSKPLYII